MAYVTDKEELKPGLIIFQRGTVQHGNWYCRVKVPKEDRYKTFSLKTPDRNAARSKAWRHDANVEYSLERDIPLFNRSFAKVAQEYLIVQERRAREGEISAQRPKKMRAVIEGPLTAYVGSKQVHLVGDDTWREYPSWRRAHGEGRSARNGTRALSREQAAVLVDRELAAREKARISRGLRARPLPGVVTTRGTTASKEAIEARDAAITKRMEATSQISDSTIRFEMSIFASVMNFAMHKRYAPVSQRYHNRPKLKIMRRDAFTFDEYRSLYRYSRDVWSKGKTDENVNRTSTDENAPIRRKRALSPTSRWYRTMVHNFVLIMCNTGMRPSEAKNLRWRDISPDVDDEDKPIVVLFVQGKGKSRQLVALPSVANYLERIRELTREQARRRLVAQGIKHVPDHMAEPKPLDRVFTTIDGTPASSLYKNLIDDLFTRAGVRVGPEGTLRSTYTFRHTYATMRLIGGVDGYLLAEQMGTTTKMIQEHYGHVDRLRYADLILRGGGGWDAIEAEERAINDATKKSAASAKASQAAKIRDQASRPATPRRRPRT